MKYEFSIVIPAPRETVWKIVQDTTLRPKWDVRVAQYTVHGSAATGTEVTIVFRALFLRPVGHGEFLMFNPPCQSILRINSVEATGSSFIPPGGGTWILDELPQGTRMTTRFSLKRSQWGLLGDCAITFFAYIDTIRSLHKLKRLVIAISCIDQ